VVKICATSERLISIDDMIEDFAMAKFFRQK
jgi:hypothetical protein